MSAETNTGSKVDFFELLMAVVLGLAAIGGGWAGYQGGLWAGNQATSFGQASNTLAEAAAVTSNANSLYNEAVQTANQDASVDLEISMLMADSALSPGTDLETVAKKEKNQLLVKYMITNKLSREAYDYWKMPDALYQSQDKFMELPDANIEAAGGIPLGDKYFEELTAEANAEFDKAEALQEKANKRFRQGRQENYNGDQFSFTGVLFTVCLFLAGIGLVFKSNIKWVFGGLGALALIVAMFDLFGNPWTEPTPVTDGPGAAASAAPGGSAAPAGSSEAKEEKKEE